MKSAATDYISLYNQNMSSELYSLVTIQEAARLYYRQPSTIRYHIDRGNLEWRKVGSNRRGIYMISLASLMKLYGKPLATLN